MSNLMMVRPGALAAGWLLTMASGSAPLQADYLYAGSDKIQEADIDQFMSALAWELRSCQFESIAARFVPGATVHLINAKGVQERLTPSEYAKGDDLCRPYRLIKWDGTHREVGLGESGGAGNMATVRWRLEWGGQEPGRNGRSMLVFENWVDLVKQGNRLSIMRAGTRSRELVPGAEETFYLKSEGGDILYPIMRVSMAIGRTVNQAVEVLKTMIGMKSDKKDNQVTNAAHRAD